MAESKNNAISLLARNLNATGDITADALAPGVAGGLDSAAITNLIDSDYVTSKTTGSIIAYNTILSGDD